MRYRYIALTRRPWRHGSPPGWYLGPALMPDSPDAHPADALDWAGEQGWELVLKNGADDFIMKRRQGR